VIECGSERLHRLAVESALGKARVLGIAFEQACAVITLVS
jgi:hypothetical protein